MLKFSSLNISRLS